MLYIIMIHYYYYYYCCCFKSILICAQGLFTLGSVLRATQSHSFLVELRGIWNAGNQIWVNYRQST